ncbi:MAG: GNAT family N-acetyltransferase [Acetatifactor sp.]
MLRAMEERDIDLLFEMINSPEIEKALGNFCLPVSESQQREWVLNFRNTEKQIRLMIELLSGVTIGVIMLYDIDMKNGTAEVGYKISAPKESRMKGDMTDALCGMLNYAFDELRLHCVTAHAIEGNEASIRLLEKVGFSKEGILRQRVYQSGRYCDVFSFSVLKSEYEAVKI